MKKMHIFRRAALRAASSSTSFVFRTRTINAPSPFVLSSTQRVVSPAIIRRFASDNAHENEEKSPEESEDQEQSTVGSAIDSAKTYASEAVGSVKEYASSAAGGARGFADREQMQVEPSDGVYVGNLLFDVTEEDLRREFAPFGEIKDVRLTRDARGLSKGFAYVTFSSIDEASAAIDAKHQTQFEGRRLVVNYINKNPKQREQNPPSKCLFIGNLAFEMSDADLNSLFRDIRNVIDVRVAIDRRTGQPRGFAHADFVDVDSAMKAAAQLQGKVVFDRTLRVDFSQGERAGADRVGGPGRYERGGDRGGDRGGRGGGFGRGGGRGGYGNRDGGRGGSYGDRGGSYGGRDGDSGSSGGYPSRGY